MITRERLVPGSLYTVSHDLDARHVAPDFSEVTFSFSNISEKRGDIIMYLGSRPMVGYYISSEPNPEEQVYQMFFLFGEQHVVFSNHALSYLVPVELPVRSDKEHLGKVAGVT